MSLTETDQYQKHLLSYPEAVHSNGYDLDHLEQHAANHRICLYPDPALALQKYEAENRNIDKSPNYKPETKTDPGLRVAAVFHKTFIKPMLATATDAYKPTPDDTHNLCRQLQSPEGVTFVISIAQCKTRSPRRTGSPDAKIDFAELEMYSHLATVTTAASVLGLNLRFILLDEATIFPEGNILGITQLDIAANRRITAAYLSKRGVTDMILIRDLDNSVKGPLNSHYDTLHHERSRSYQDQINLQLAAAAETGSLTGQHKATIEAFVLFDCIPDTELIRAGVDPRIRKDINSPADLPKIPHHLLDEVVALAAHCEAVLSLRDDAAKMVMPADYTNYPEHNPQGKVSAGVTRRDSRISFLPHPNRYKGRTVFPMHGLAVYGENSSYQGNIPLSLITEITGSEVVYSHNQKPLFVKINPA